MQTLKPGEFSQPKPFTDERGGKKGVKLVLLGKSGIGKTTQLKTLPEASTLFVDLEAGDLAVKDWHGDCVRPAKRVKVTAASSVPVKSIVASSVPVVSILASPPLPPSDPTSQCR